PNAILEIRAVVDTIDKLRSGRGARASERPRSANALDDVLAQLAALDPSIQIVDPKTFAGSVVSRRSQKPIAPEQWAEARAEERLALLEMTARGAETIAGELREAAHRLAA